MSPIATKPLVRYLRIGWTVCFGVLCLLMIGWWARSYWYFDELVVRVHQSLAFGIGSIEGRFRFGCQIPAERNSQFIATNLETSPQNLVADYRRSKPDYGFSGGRLAPGFYYFEMPYYCAVFLLASAVMLSWRFAMQGIRSIPHRFSLRTLLIFTTLVAVVLGAIVWAVRN